MRITLVSRAEFTTQDHRTVYKTGIVENVGAICDKAEHLVPFIGRKSKIQSLTYEMLVYIKLFHFQSRLQARIIKRIV